MRKGEIWIIAGKAGAGKTSLALQFARAFADKPEHTVAFLSLEMRGWQLALRMYCEMNGQDHTELLNGRTELDPDLARVFKDYTQQIDFEAIEGGYTFKETEAAIREIYKAKKPDIIFLDYIQLIEWHEYGDERVALMEYIRKIKEMANKLNIGFVIVSQLRRQPSGADYQREPDLADLKGSGSLEATADKVLFIFKKITKNGPITYEQYFINMAKNRQGPTQCSEVEFQGQFYRFRDKEAPPQAQTARDVFNARETTE